jgi:cation diffusion facilitator family transporter
MSAALERDPSRARRQRTALWSVCSNSGLILLKVLAGILTGSVAILTEAVHSSIDLIGSIVTFFSIRKAGEPADESHRYGHEKIENLAAAIEGILILIGSIAISFAAVRRLLEGGRDRNTAIGIGVIAFAILVNLLVSHLLARRGAQAESPALQGDAAHLRTDAASAAAVLLALILVTVTGAGWIDPAFALLVAAGIVLTGVRLLTRSGQVLVDQSLPPAEVEAIRSAVESFAREGVVGYHELRTRRGGSRRYVDLHVQFRAGISLEAAHRIAHRLQDVIASRLRGADVLIHLEPEDRVRPGEQLLAGGGTGGDAAQAGAQDAGPGKPGPGAGATSHGAPTSASALRRG